MGQICLRKGTRKVLREQFKFSESALSMALHFKYNSLLARRVRVYAVNKLNAFPLLDV